MVNRSKSQLLMNKCVAYKNDNCSLIKLRLIYLDQIATARSELQAWQCWNWLELESVPSGWWRSFLTGCVPWDGWQLLQRVDLSRLMWQEFWQFRPIVNKPWAFIVAKTLLVRFTHKLTQSTTNAQYNTCVDLNCGIRHPLCPHKNRCPPNSTM